MTAVRVGLVCLLLGGGGIADRASAPDSLDVRVPPIGDYQQRPVYYECHPPTDRRGELDLLRSGRVRLPHYPPRDVTEFALSAPPGVEPMWWMQWQEMRFLLPLIASDARADRALAKRYLAGWFKVYMVPEPQIREWGEPMTVAYRAMVFVFYLKREEGRAHPDADVVSLLRASILEHQRYLAVPSEIDEFSNHAYMDALGLFETTRVFADRKLAAGALERLRAMLDRAVTPRGVEREHTPYYHFVVMQWVEDTAEYMQALPSVPGAFVEQLRSCAARMRDAAYFLQDHAGVIPQIGDGDSVTVEKFRAAYRFFAAAGTSSTLFDPSSGYAIYKGHAAVGDCRYVVFRNPADRIGMANHAHADVLSVYFSDAGETILGDAGRFAYGSGMKRSYFLSACAHNTIIASGSLTAPMPSLNPPVAQSTQDWSDGGGVRWSASREIAGSLCRRAVNLGDEANAVSVVDSIQPARAGGEPEELAWVWNLGSDVASTTVLKSVVPGGWEWALTTRRGRGVRLRINVSGTASSAPARVEVIRGQDQPMLGWYSPSQGVRRPTTVIVVRALPAPALVVRTDVEIGRGSCAVDAGPRAGKKGHGGDHAPAP